MSKLGKNHSRKKKRNTMTVYLLIDLDQDGSILHHSIWERFLSKKKKRRIQGKGGRWAKNKIQKLKS